MLAAILFVLIAVFAAKLIRPARPTNEKLKTYECGENPEGSPWVKFNIRFYVVALIFLIFDVEVVMLIPWALIYKQTGLAGFLVGLGNIFLLIGLGFLAIMVGKQVLAVIAKRRGSPELNGSYISP